MNPTKSEMIFGLRPLLEAIQADKTIEKIIIQKDLQGDLFKELNQKLKTGDKIPVQMVPKEALNKITNENHQGVIAYISPIEFVPIEQKIMAFLDEGITPRVLVLDHITDVRNFGAIIRSAEAMGVNLIILPLKGSARINGDAIKSSTGSVFNIAMSRIPNLIDAVDLLKALGLKIVSATEKGHLSISDADFTGPLALIMGSEEKGITKSILKRSDMQVNIPMNGKTASLNVSVAAGIILYEINRQTSLNN
jgi:23S rRNA (guanosine2251-2'-O)-methyltransferase